MRAESPECSKHPSSPPETDSQSPPKVDDVYREARELRQYTAKLLAQQNDELQLLLLEEIRERELMERDTEEMMKYSSKNEKLMASIHDHQQVFDVEQQAMRERRQELVDIVLRNTVVYEEAARNLKILEGVYDEHMRSLAAKQAERNEILTHHNLMEGKLNEARLGYKQAQQKLEKMTKELKTISLEIEDIYLTKKKLNNELQQQRGNIRVYCRIRPLLGDEKHQGNCIYQLLNDNTLKLTVPKQLQKSENHKKEHIFNFEQIYDMHEDQESIFRELCQLIQGAVDGKNVCIFAYGQTGSGKTYTMQGGPTDHTRGIIPRSIQLILSEVEKAKQFQWVSEVSVSVQQVYLDTVTDLLQPKNSDQVASRLNVTEYGQIEMLLSEATKNRKVAETNSNERSSRSHLIFTIHISSKNAEKGLERKGSLNLVDLAGSERVNESGVTGDRLKQTQAINKSLTHLGVVISSLSRKQAHTPFRNSKLTFLLQKYLEGDSRTLMLVNISPSENDYNQTICSLKFADKVKDCRLKK